MINKPDRKKMRKKRHGRIRNKIDGTDKRPRLNVYRSLNNIYAQIIDDEEGNTIVSACTLSPELKSKFQNGANIEAAQAVGELIAKKAIDKGIDNVIFDRGGYIYHGRIKALADAARENGLKF